LHIQRAVMAALSYFPLSVELFSCPMRHALDGAGVRILRLADRYYDCWSTSLFFSEN
jgi:hypothetical protein